MRLLSVTHSQRWHAYFGTAGYGPIYQGRFQSFPVKSDNHFLKVARYVERNARRAKLVDRAEQWKWSSISQINLGSSLPQVPLSRWPIERSTNWVDLVNQPDKDKELAALRLGIKRGRPFGDMEWQMMTAKNLCLESFLRNPGRPAKT